MLKNVARIMFFNSNTKQQIKKTLSTINKALKQLSQERRVVILSRVNNTLGKYHGKTNEIELEKFLKELKFNLNFIKLSNPSLDYSLDLEPENTQTQKNNEEDKISLDGFDEKVVTQYNESVKKTPREQVDFTNWFQGNADPELLKKHKQLLTRQHFGGQFWKDKSVPEPSAKAFLLDKLRNNPEVAPEKNQILEDTPIEIQQGDQYWEKVKR